LWKHEHHSSWSYEKLSAKPSMMPPSGFAMLLQENELEQRCGGAAFSCHVVAWVCGWVRVRGVGAGVCDGAWFCALRVSGSSKKHFFGKNGNGGWTKK